MAVLFPVAGGALAPYVFNEIELRQKSGERHRRSGFRLLVVGTRNCGPEALPQSNLDAFRSVSGS